MKVYSRPEVLEAHIAPAALITDNAANADNGSLSNEAPPDSSEFSTIDPEPEPEPLVISNPEFRIRTITFDADGSLQLGGIESVGTVDGLFLTLLGESRIGTSIAAPSNVSLLDDLDSGDSVIDAIQSVIANHPTMAFAGLSSEEFERSGGSAFLTSL
jgi:hypothetical protein